MVLSDLGISPGITDQIQTFNRIKSIKETQSLEPPHSAIKMFKNCGQPLEWRKKIRINSGWPRLAYISGTFLLTSYSEWPHSTPITIFGHACMWDYIVEVCGHSFCIMCLYNQYVTSVACSYKRRHSSLSKIMSLL